MDMPGALHVLRRTAELVVPVACACGSGEGRLLCPDCAERIRARPVRVDAACGALQRLRSADIRTGSTDFAPSLPVLALGAHADALRHQVLAFKNGGQFALAAPLGRAMAAGLPLLGLGPDQPVLLVPVPSSRAHRLRRGEDHTALLARAIASAAPGAPRVVRAVRMTPGTQAGKGGRDRVRERSAQIRVRAAAVRRARAAGPGSPPLVLVDDVATTGATLRAIQERLEEHGCTLAGALVIAAARLPRPPVVL